MLLLEGVQAGGKEEEGEGSERGSHLRVQDRAQDGVRRSEGEEVESACWSRKPHCAVCSISQYATGCCLRTTSVSCLFF